MLKNENSVVTSLVSRDEAQTAEIDELVDNRFGGSMPAFISAFTRSKKLSAAEQDELRRLIDGFKRGESGD